MGRKSRQGFVLYGDIVLNHLQYLSDADFKTIIIAAVKASEAIAYRKPEPEPPPLSGAALGCFLTIMRTVRESQTKYDGTCVRNKMNRNNKKPKNLLPMSNEQLLNLGYTVYDIAALRECDPEEIIAATSRDLSSPEVTNVTYPSVLDKENENKSKHDLESDLEKDPDYGFDGCDKLYAALERQGIKVTPAIRRHLRMLRLDEFTEELMIKVYNPAFLDELRRLK